MKKKISKKSDAKNPVKSDTKKVKDVDSASLDLNLDLNKLKYFFKKSFPILLILVVMIIAFHIRAGPITLSGLDERIEQNTLSQIRSLISQEISQQYPDLNEIYKQELIDEKYSEVLDTGRYTIQGQTIVVSQVVEQNAEAVKSSFKSDNGQTYFNAIDPYSFYRQAENLLERGSVGDVEIDGVGYENKRLAPALTPVKEPTFHVWFEAFLFKLFGMSPESSIGEKTSVVFLIPVIFASLSVIPCFLIIRRFSDDISAFFGSLILVSVGTFVSRTIAGFVDTDAYNVFFPLLIVMFLVYGFMFKDLKWSISFALIAGFFQGLFMWVWGSAWFMFIFISGALISYLGYVIVTKVLENKRVNLKDKAIVNDFFTLLSFGISSLLFSIMFTGRNIFETSYKGVTGSLSGIAGISSSKIWPNVYSSVAELNPASFNQVISSVGGKLIFLIAMIGLISLVLDFFSKKKKYDLIKKTIFVISLIWFALIIYNNLFVSLTANSALLFLAIMFFPIGVGILFSLWNGNFDRKVFLVLLLTIWISGTIYMSLNGVRFILLLTPAFAISFGFGLFYIAKLISSFLQSEIKLKDENKSKIAGYVVVSVVFLVLFSPIYSTAENISKNTLPNFDDAWYSSMYKIKNNSSEDAIITSWWDFGHFFAAVADRGVTFDGGSQTTPQSHWVGKLLMENDERVSHDILRMLVCGGNEAHNTMLKYSLGSNADAVKINKVIYDTFGKNISETRVIISDNPYYEYSDEQVDEIMSYLACEEPRENFVITSEDMIGKAGVWAHWGSWDFTKKYVHDNYKSLSVEKMASDVDENVTVIGKYVDELNEIDLRSETQNIKRNNLINQWFAPYPSYIPIQGRYSYPCQLVENNILSCQNGILVNVTNNEVFTAQNLQGQVSFNRLIFPSGNDTLVEVPQGNGNVDVLLIPNQNAYDVMLMQYPLGGSLFTKLFYLNGFGTEKFELFDDVRSATGTRVITWKTKWE